MGCFPRLFTVPETAPNLADIFAALQTRKLRNSLFGKCQKDESYPGTLNMVAHVAGAGKCRSRLFKYQTGVIQKQPDPLSGLEECLRRGGALSVRQTPQGRCNVVTQNMKHL